jgi:hypothetical protein
MENYFSNILNPCFIKYYSPLHITYDGSIGRTKCVKIFKDGKQVMTGPAISETTHFKK